MTAARAATTARAARAATTVPGVAIVTAAPRRDDRAPRPDGAAAEP